MEPGSVMGHPLLGTAAGGTTGALLLGGLAALGGPAAALVAAVVGGVVGAVAGGAVAKEMSRWAACMHACMVQRLGRGGRGPRPQA